VRDERVRSRGGAAGGSVGASATSDEASASNRSARGSAGAPDDIEGGGGDDAGVAAACSDGVGDGTPPVIGRVSARATTDGWLAPVGAVVDADGAPWAFAAIRFVDGGGNVLCAVLLAVVAFCAGMTGSSEAETFFCFLPLALATFGSGAAFFTAGDAGGA